jgi:hypothetical protein
VPICPDMPDLTCNNMCSTTGVVQKAASIINEV